LGVTGTGGAAGRKGATSGVPHLRQNLSVSLLEVPHFEQGIWWEVTARGSALGVTGGAGRAGVLRNVPHLAQNLSVSILYALHLGHNI